MIDTDVTWREGPLGAALTACPAVAVLRAPTYGDGARIAGAITRGGIRAIEFTLTGDNALAAMQRAVRVSDAVVGVGSVTDVEAAQRSVEAGAQFVVCPILASEVAAAGLGVPVVLAGATPSELYRAWQCTRAPVKVFPAGGPAQIAAIRGPLPQIPLMPSGGIDADNAREYLEAGAVAVNAGSSLCPPDALVHVDEGLLARNTRRFVAQLTEG